MKIKKIAAGFIVLALALANGAWADIIFGIGASPANQNVTFTQGGATSATGQVGADDVVFVLANDDVHVGAGGNQLDADGDGALDRDEVLDTDYVCNGAAGERGDKGCGCSIPRRREPIGAGAAALGMLGIAVLVRVRAARRRER